MHLIRELPLVLCSAIQKMCMHLCLIHGSTVKNFQDKYLKRWHSHSCDHDNEYNTIYNMYAILVNGLGKGYVYCSYRQPNIYFFEKTNQSKL